MENCTFCKIVKKVIPAEIIYEDSKIMAFLDINPVHPGHALIIPREHHKMMTDTPDNIISYIFIKSKELMKVIKTATNADYVAVSVVGIDVPHFHIHLIPRYKNDGLSNTWPTKKYKENEVKETAKKIKQYLK